MSPLAAAVLVSILVFATVMLLYAFIRWALASRRTTRQRLDRWANIYGLERQPKERNRQLLRRINASIQRAPRSLSRRKRVK